MAPVHTRMSPAGRVLMACFAAVALATAAHAVQKSVATIEELRAAINDATVDQIVVTSHLTLDTLYTYTKIDSSSGEASNFTIPMPPVTRTGDLAVWGDCTDPMPAWATDLKIPADYVRTNACGFWVAENVSGAKSDPIFQLAGGSRFWMSNMVIHNSATNTSNYVAINSNGGPSVWVADMVLSGKGNYLIALEGVNGTVADSAFILGTNTSALNEINTGINSPFVSVSGCLAIGDNYQELSPFFFSNVQSVSNIDSTMTVTSYDNRVEGSVDPNATCTGMCFLSLDPNNFTAIQLYSDASSPFSDSYGEFAGVTVRFPVNASILADLKPRGDDAAWLDTLTQANVPGTDKVLNPTLASSTPNSPPPDKAGTDTPPVSSAQMVAAASIVLTVAAFALLLV